MSDLGGGSDLREGGRKVEPENWASCFGTLAGLFGIIERVSVCGSSWVGEEGVCM